MNALVSSVRRFVFPFLVGALLFGPAFGQEQVPMLDIGFTADSGKDAVISVPLTRSRADEFCHDGLWPDAEFCGFDAIQNTGTAELNHDCFSDILDFRLLARYWMLTGPNLSGDLNGDQMVQIFDLAVFVGSVGTAACPCNPSGMLPDGCQGTAAVSFEPDTIVQTGTMSPGIDSLYVILDGYANASLFETMVVTSPNIQILNYAITTELDGYGIFDPDPQHSYRAAVKVGEAFFSAPPITFGTITFFLMDANPAWIKLEPFDFGIGLGERLRWCGLNADHSLDFQTILNAGINGPAPPGVSTCGMSLGNPCGGVSAPEIAAEVGGSVALRLQNDPNPFGARTTIQFELPEPAPVMLSIHDVTGRRVRTLIHDTAKGAGVHTVEWDGTDENGRPVSSGVYHGRLLTGTAAKTTRMVLVR